MEYLGPPDQNSGVVGNSTRHFEREMSTLSQKPCLCPTRLCYTFSSKEPGMCVEDPAQRNCPCSQTLALCLGHLPRDSWEPPTNSITNLKKLGTDLPLQTVCNHKMDFVPLERGLAPFGETKPTNVPTSSQRTTPHKFVCVCARVRVCMCGWGCWRVKCKWAPLSTLDLRRSMWRMEDCCMYQLRHPWPDSSLSQFSLVLGLSGCRTH